MTRHQFGINILIIGISFIVYSCDPVYIPDPIDPRLPKYTEDGNRVAGAFVNDRLWRSEYQGGGFWGFSTDEPMINYFSIKDSIALSFSGHVDQSSVSMIFGLKGYGITSLSEMTKLKGAIIEFDGATSAATLYRLGFEDCTTEPTGQIYFRQVNYNSESEYITISGTFGFDYNDPICGKIAVTYGRFDYNIFYFYQ